MWKKLIIQEVTEEGPRLSLEHKPHFIPFVWCVYYEYLKSNTCHLTSFGLKNKGLGSWRWLSKWSDCRTNMEAWVWIPRAHLNIPPWQWTPATPALGGDRPIPEPYWPAILAKTMNFLFSGRSCLWEENLFASGEGKGRTSVTGIIIIRVYFITPYMNEVCQRQTQ